MDRAGADIYEQMPKVKAAVSILHPSVSPGGKIEDAIPLNLGDFFPSGGDEVIAGVSHFLPMEAPALVAQKIRKAIGLLG
jgi:hypothetical protein